MSKVSDPVDPVGPMFVEAVLIPFRNVIITDGLLSRREYRSPLAVELAEVSTRSTARRGRRPRFSRRFQEAEPEQVALSARPRAPSKPCPRPTLRMPAVAEWSVASVRSRPLRLGLPASVLVAGVMSEPVEFS
jgi:hypothetical protein